MTLWIIAAAVIAIIMLAMAVGVIFRGQCLRGSCGGPQIFDSENDPVYCEACPYRQDAEQQSPEAVGARAGIVPEGKEHDHETVPTGARDEV